MVNNNLKIIASCLLISSLVVGCSSNSVKPEKTQQTNLDRAFKITERTTPKALPNKVVGQSGRVAKPQKQKVRRVVKKVVKRNPVRHIPAARKSPARRIANIQRQGNWGLQRANALTGDFSGNLQTISFINMMVNKYGFDRGHLNYVFSNTHATTFLQKMAYNDAHPVKRTRKSRKGSWTRYRNLFLTSRTINKGVQFWKQNRIALQRAEQQFGVPQEYILGIIGVETRYGGNVGQNRAIDALATMGFNNPRRGNYFQSELESYLLMTRRTGLNPLNPKASYAGALGLCQFMPSNIKRYGVDHDRNGTCNLWTPSDAIGSVANYFSKHGWRKGGSVAVLATTKGKKYRNFKSSYKKTHSLSKMRRNGISPLGPIDSSVRLLRMSTNSGDEVWLAGHNFYVITRYNHSSKYAMAVHQLAQALRKRIKPIRMASR
jgi:membrane-bound lytic murein transglycosylase B